MLLTIREAASRIGCSPGLVYALCREGVLPRVQIGLGHHRPRIRIREDDLEGYIESKLRGCAPGKKLRWIKSSQN